MYGNKRLIIEDKESSLLIKKLSINMIYRMKINETCYKKFHHILDKLKNENRKSDMYQKFFTTLLTIVFRNNLLMETKYQDPITKITIDHLIKSPNNSKEIALFFIPKIYTINSFEKNEKIEKGANGIINLLINVFRRLTNYKIVIYFEEDIDDNIEKQLENSFNDFIQKNIFN